jgi:HipA-like protein
MKAIKLNAKIYLHDEHVADLSSNGVSCHVKLRDYFLSNPGRSTLSLSIASMNQDKLSAFQNPGSPLPPFIKILLPEGAVREQLIEDSDMYIDEFSFAADVYLLDLCGKDLSGAITVKEVVHENVLDDFRKEVKKADKKENARTLSGAQEKFSVNKYKKKLSLSIDSASGSHIAKPQPKGSLPNIASNEFFCMRLAGESGINVPKTELITSNIGGGEDRPCYVVERFDRVAGEKIHMEEIHQMLKLEGKVVSNSKYEDFSYAEVVQFLNQVDSYYGIDITGEYLKELSFSVIIGNNDFHLKNSAVIFPDKIVPQKAPSYDLLNTTIYDFTKMAQPVFDGVEVEIIDFDNNCFLEILLKAKDSNPEHQSIFENMKSIVPDALERVRSQNEIIETCNQGVIDQIINFIESSTSPLIIDMDR